MKHTLHAQSNRAPRNLSFLCILLLQANLGHAGSARFAERITFQQPDGNTIELRGEGNEFQAVYEGLDGYTVVFDPALRAYVYAELSSSGDDLVPTGVLVGSGDPAKLGIPTHLRINAEAARAQVRQRKQEFEERLQLRERWSNLKASRVDDGSRQRKVLRYGPTLGTKVGLTLLIDFEDAPATLARSNIVEFLNGESYRGNGNNGSVKQYYYDVSDGKLLYQRGGWLHNHTGIHSPTKLLQRPESASLGSGERADS
jgi:hypothetical protein